MAGHGGVTLKSKKYSGNTLHKSDVSLEQFSGRRRPAETPREAAQKAGMALKKSYPILHVGVLDVEAGHSEVIVPPSV